MSKRLAALLALCFCCCLTSLSGEYYLIILVDARHLDNTDFCSLARTIIQQKDRRVGHAWIYLHGVVDSKCVSIEGGHSGELGICQPKYFDGIMNYLEYGHANPSMYEKMHPIYEPNPVKYLWEVQKDGFFQYGSGGHRPTFAARINLTELHFYKILDYIQNYNYAQFSLVNNQCCTFAAGAAELAGVRLCHQATIPIQQCIRVGREKYLLWQDPQYSFITLSSPDVLEAGLKEAVRQGKAIFIQ